MHSAWRAIAFGFLGLALGQAQTPQPTTSELEAMERFLAQPGARIAWLKEIGSVPAEEARAVITALVAEDQDRRMRGVRIELSQGEIRDRVYTSDEHLPRLINALDEITKFLPAWERRSRAQSDWCFGAAAFWQQQGHAFSASHCTDGWWTGLKVGTGLTRFRFAGVPASEFAGVLRRAQEELERQR